MSLRIILSTLLSLFVLTACQVKETESSGGLISGHNSTTNKFTVTGPAAGNYVTGNHLTFNLAFPFSLIVTGAPRLRIVVGATTQYANYLSGNGTNNLTFDYTVTGSDNDTDGIALQALELNGGTIQFDSNGTLTNANVATVTARDFTNVIIDNAAPTVTSVNFSPISVAAFYPNNSVIQFTATFSENVYVTGSPQMAITFNGGGLRHPVYAGGSGTTSLIFTYTITQSDFDIDGYAFGANILLNSGTIKDNAGNNAVLSFTTTTVASASATRDVDGRLPHILSVTPPANGTYLAAQDLDVVVEFDRNVNVSTGTRPYINLTIGANTRQALYQSGTGTSHIIFRYTTIPGDVAPSGIVIGPTINDNTSGTINGAGQTCNGNLQGSANNNCFYGDNRNTFFLPPVTTGVIVNSIQPQAISVNRGVDTTLPKWGTAVADNVWIIGQDLLITVGFNTNMFVNQGSGTPRIPITLASGTVYATYLSGGDGQTSLVFKYTIQENDLANTGAGITLGNIDLNGGNITNSSNTNTLLTLPAPGWVTTRVDGVRPKIDSVVKPSPTGTFSTVKDLIFTVNWSKAVRYTTTSTVSFPVDIGGTSRNAVYLAGDQTNSITHRPSLTSTNDNDGVVVTTTMTATDTVTDLVGNTANVFTFPPLTTTDILVDTVRPTVLSINSPSDDTYTAGDVLNFTFNFSEPVTVTVNGANPCVSITVGATARCLMPTTGGPASSHVFSYTVVAADTDNNGIVMGTAISSSASGHVRDVADNTPTAHTAPSLSAVLIDNTAPIISSRVMLTAAGTYTSGTTLQMHVNYSENVIVNGVPEINVPATSGTLTFSYVSGSGTSQLLFEYTLDPDDYDFDGLGAASNVLLPSGATIQDLADINATNTGGALTPSTILLVFPGTKLWTRNNFLNRAPAGGVTIGLVGAVNPEDCVSTTIQCQVFDGSTNSLSITGGGSITNASTVFIAFRAPATPANFDLIIGQVELRDNSGVFDVATPNDIYLGAAAYTIGSVHNTAIAQSSVNVLEIDHATGESYPNGILIPTTFQGSIGEIWIIEGLVDPAKKAIMRNYLNSRFP